MPTRRDADLPNQRVAEHGFGISTAITGGGKYVPEDIRFQTL